MAITTVPGIYGTMIPLAFGIRHACEEESKAKHPQDLNSKAWRASINLGSATLAGIIQSPFVYAWDKRKAQQYQFSQMTDTMAREIIAKKGPAYMRSVREIYFGAGCIRGLGAGVVMIGANEAYRAYKTHTAKD
jgi:hypothetical protein